MFKWYSLLCNHQYPFNEQLLQACWNGLLWEMLPELLAHAEYPKKLYLWQVVEARNFFVLELGESKIVIDKSASIDPYYFLADQINN